ncbi:MAG: ATP-binding cassette domain-containing protein [Actinomycetota bacterium]|nr:ATP-binding cassette domain-containing protein [Actinomycetota bacterium]
MPPGDAADTVTPSPAAPLMMADVTKRYRGRGGIEQVSLSVAGGEVLAFLGPNGAGKTTTIRLLLDLIRPEAGQVRLFGLDPRADGTAVRRRVGYLPGELSLYDRLTARELLTHFAHLRGGTAAHPFAGLADRLDLELDTPIHALSKGNRQKVGLVQAFMGEPELLILDEPTTGLDPLVQQEVLDIVRGSTGRGAAVFLSSHVLSEVARVADRVGMIRAGRLLRLERGAAPAVDDLSGAVGRQGTGSGATTMAPAAPEGGATDGDGTPPTS